MLHSSTYKCQLFEHCVHKYCSVDNRLDNRFGNSVACLEHLFSGLVFSVCTVSVIYIHGFAALFAFVSLLELNTALNGAGPKQLLMSDFVKVLISFTASTS